MTDIEKLPQHLTTIELSDWNKLFDLLDEIKPSEKFGELKGGERNSDNTITFPYWETSELVSKFFETVHELGIVVVFDWTSWEEGNAILNNEQQNYEHLDTITLCKLLTTIIRADRFTDGYLVCCFKDGTIPKIIHSLKNNIDNGNNAIS